MLGLKKLKPGLSRLKNSKNPTAKSKRKQISKVVTVIYKTSSTISLQYGKNNHLVNCINPKLFHCRQISATITTLNNQIKLLKNLKAQDNQQFLEKYRKLIDAELNFRNELSVYLANCEDKMAPLPTTLNKKQFDSGFYFFVKYPQALYLIDEMENLITKKEYSKFQQNLLKINKIYPKSLAQFIKNPVTLEGKNILLMANAKGDDKFMSILQEIGFSLD